mgnify:CR=1 FL=1
MDEKSQILNETVNFILPALGLVVAFAWRDAITNTVESLIKTKLQGTFLESYPLLLYYIYALLLTIACVFVTKYISKLKRATK